MPNWLLVLLVVLASTVVAFTLAEWLARRYTVEIRRRRGAGGDAAARDAGDPFDDDGRTAG